MQESLHNTGAALDIAFGAVSRRIVVAPRYAQRMELPRVGGVP